VRKTGEKPIVYVIDDDPSFNALVLQVLGRYGIIVEAFREPPALLARAKALPPDLCIVDLNLGPTLKGYDLIAQLRALTRDRTPIIIASSSAETTEIAHAVEMGADDYLFKPLDREVLNSKLMNYLTTEELELSKPYASQAEQTDIETTLSLQATLLEIDETGVRVLSPHLILKGTVISLSGGRWQEIAGRERPVLVTVTSVAVAPNERAYDTYLEFEPKDKELAQSVRNWISKQQPKDS
jgi:DNA-binding response OmpR family regulator